MTLILITKPTPEAARVPKRSLMQALLWPNVAILQFSNGNWSFHQGRATALATFIALPPLHIDCISSD